MADLRTENSTIAMMPPIRGCPHSIGSFSRNRWTVTCKNRKKVGYNRDKRCIILVVPPDFEPVGGRWGGEAELDGGDAMGAVRRLIRERVNKAVERDRRAEGRVEAVSRLLWPWREPWLIALVGLLALLDYATTCAALELSGKGHIEEGGMLAGWALRIGGLGWLFLVDIGAVIVLSIAAITARILCFRVGFQGFGRAAFVVLLVPYAVVAFAAVVNNLVLTFL